MANILYLIKLYATAIVIYMTVDAIKILNSIRSLNWFFEWGCVVIIVVICVMVTYCELKGIKFDME